MKTTVEIPDNGWAMLVIPGEKAKFFIPASPHISAHTLLDVQRAALALAAGITDSLFLCVEDEQTGGANPFGLAPWKPNLE